GGRWCPPVPREDCSGLRPLASPLRSGRGTGPVSPAGRETRGARQIGAHSSGVSRQQAVREVIRLGDRGAASPGESWIRVAVVRTGFPRPDTQIPVMGRHGRWLYVDLGYPEFQVGLEYDGERYHSGRRARTHDARRRDWLAKEMGWEIIPVTKSFLH